MFSSNASSVSGDANYIEDVFNTWLFTGTGGSGGNPVIVNGIDLANKGGMVWFKDRTAVTNHALFDTVRGVGPALSSNTTTGNTTGFPLLSFNNNGFSLTNNTFNANTAGNQIASWTFREQPKFFDVVTYTGNGVDGRFINHTLTSTPGAIFIKRTDTTSNWVARCKTSTGDTNLRLNDTSAADNTTGGINTNGYCGFADTSTFAVYTGATDISAVNASGGTYVAYLFAHNAGGFGLTGTDNVISCGSYTGNGTTGNAVTLGYEPQFVMIKRTDSTGNWFMQDIMRGIPNSGSSFYLYANTSEAETDGGVPTVIPTATGFTLPSFGGWNASGGTYIYIAIRRGPMKVPTTGTSVFTPIARNGTGTNTIVTGVGFPSDLALIKLRSSGNVTADYDRLRGSTANLQMNVTDAEAVYSGETVSFDQQDGFGLGPSTSWEYTNRLASPNAYVNWLFRRAPGFFDEVCYTGTGVARTVAHNLAAVPELMIVKKRSASGTDWNVYHSALGNTQVVFLDLTNATATAPRWNDTTPTASVFSIGSHTQVNESAATFVWYGFATCPGVSKVGSYTGNGSSQTINCGFTGGARFVLIKRTDDTGDWYVWDTARGIVSGNDPHLSLNTTAAEVTSNDTIDTDSTGFVVNQVSATNVNVSSATYIFLAIA
jgi:hypothetical protein